MKKPREKLRVESVESQIPRARREKLLIRRLSDDSSVMGRRWARREDCACRRMNGVTNSNSRIIMKNVEIDCNRQFRGRKRSLTGKRADLLL